MASENHGGGETELSSYMREFERVRVKISQRRRRKCKGRIGYDTQVSQRRH